jgi:hypothetical protein
VNNGAHPAVRQAMRGLTGAIGWIGASVAGLTALLYGAGYFVIHTHLTMLGLSGVVDVPTDQLLLEGGRFFYYTLSQMVTFALVVAAIMIAIWLTATIIIKFSPIGRIRLVAVVRNFLKGAAVERVAPYVIPVAIMGAVILLYDWYYYELDSLLQLQNLAFAPVVPEKNTLAEQVQPLIRSGTTGDRDGLIQTYMLFVWKYTAFITFAWLVVYNGSRTVLGKFSNFLLILFAILLTALLPSAFAVLVRTPIYPVANLVFKNGNMLRALLIQRTEHNVLVWLPARRGAASFNAEEVASVEVVGERDIFRKDPQP